MASTTIVSIDYTANPINNDLLFFDATIGGNTISISYVYKAIPNTPKGVQIATDLAQTIINTRNVFVTLDEFNGYNVTYEITGNVLQVIINEDDVVIDNITDEPTRYVITFDEEAITPKINVRSPYFITVNEPGQEGSKIEIFLWNFGVMEPVTPTKTLSKMRVSASQPENQYNVSNYAYDFLQPIKARTSTVVERESDVIWCYMKVKQYKLVAGDYTLVNTETFICLNGFNNFLDGKNYALFSDTIPMSNTAVRRYQTEDFDHYINIWLNAGDYNWNGDDYTAEDEGVFKLPLINGTNTFSDIDGVVFTMVAENVCEPVYTPVKVSYMNRFGGWDFITLFKSAINTYEAESKDYNTMPDRLDYSIFKGQSGTFNHKLKQKVRANTGWVNQNFIELLRDLMVSETILLDDKPVKITTKNIEEKTHIRDNNINYELEFEYAFNLINDVV